MTRGLGLAVFLFGSPLAAQSAEPAPLPAEAAPGVEVPARAELEIVVDQPNTAVLLDGETLGVSPVERQSLRPGQHRVELRKPGFITQAREMELLAGPIRLDFTMVAEPVQGKLWVTTSTPAGGAELLVNGAPVGRLPWQGQLPVGGVQLSARTAHGTSLPVSVIVDSQTPKSIVLELPVELRLAAPPSAFTPPSDDARDTAPTAPEAPSGLYVRLDLGGIVGQNDNTVSANCEASSVATCSSTGPLGALLGLRVGYRFGWLAPELFGLGLLDVTYVKANYSTASTAADGPFYGPARREDYTLFRYGFAAGVAARATTLGRTFNATGSVGFGLFAMSERYARATTSSARYATPSGGMITVPSARSTASSVESTLAPGLLFDGGVIIGASPGTKLYVGLLASLEFAPNDARVRGVDTTLGTDAAGQPAPYGTPALDIARGAQFHIGPVLAFQFGN